MLRVCAILKQSVFFLGVVWDFFFLDNNVSVDATKMSEKLSNMDVSWQPKFQGN